MKTSVMVNRITIRAFSQHTIRKYHWKLLNCHDIGCINSVFLGNTRFSWRFCAMCLCVGKKIKSYKLYCIHHSQFWLDKIFYHFITWLDITERYKHHSDLELNPSHVKLCYQSTIKFYCNIADVGQVTFYFIFFFFVLIAWNKKDNCNTCFSDIHKL